MANYSTNKGIGKPAEFKGLKSQYLFLFAGGLLGLFVVFVVLYMAGVNEWICILFGIITALILVYGIFYLNGKYGEHGLMKRQAAGNHPRYVLNRRSLPRLLAHKQKEEV
ncbi:hypothetical protein EZS27_028499 [termite gut metagenome]|uniref:DUF4133 domain-containing protein n=1 Tax=termite gut metagenome TaxID=433724 RepID=A0A5J4QKI4_9ZZZZ